MAKRVNLALQGGGAHGALSWGVADRLLEDPRIEVGAISGASAGAVNAVALAYGLHQGGEPGARASLETLWREISKAGEIFSPVRANPFAHLFGGADIISDWTHQMFSAITRSFSPYQLNPMNFNPLKEILERCVDFDSLKACETTQLYIAATNVRSGKVHVFECKDMSVDAVLASSCLPMMFQAVEIDGEHYWDGGYMGNPVLYPFFYEAESSDIVIVHINPLYRDEVPTAAPDIMNRVNEISFNSSLLRELRAISFVHKLLDEGWIKDEFRDRLRDIRIHSVRSDEALRDEPASTKFRTDWAYLQELKDKGRALAADWLDAHYDEIGTRSSVDLRAMFDGSA